MTGELTRQDEDTLGGRLQKAREGLGLSTAALAGRLGVRAETLRGWEHDRAEPRANRLVMLSGLLGVTPAWLIGGYGDGPEDAEADDAALEAKLERLIARRDELQREIDRLQQATRSRP